MSLLFYPQKSHRPPALRDDRTISGLPSAILSAKIRKIYGINYFILKKLQKRILRARLCRFARKEPPNDSEKNWM
jgi:hypothetical protein